jgi:DNA-binding transcriptional LysR family regulator
MQDLNDFVWFVKVVDYGGFAAAGRALDQPKSKLSRRIAQLEERLGVRLIQRTTRQFTVTEVGRPSISTVKRCWWKPRRRRRPLLRCRLSRAVLSGSPARNVAACPRGTDAGAVYGALPGINLQLEATNRRVDLVGEGIDVAIRVRPRPFDDSDLVLRVLADRGIVWWRVRR